MYGVESDIRLIYNQYGIRMKNIYDQKILVNVLNFENTGLDDVINTLFGIENSHKTKYQKANWQRRPLKEDAIMYALSDVKYLFKINDLLIKKIISENKVNDLIMRIIKSNFDFDKVSIPGIFKKKEFKKLSENNKIIFKEIYEVRDNYAKILNMPPHNILENKILFNIVNKKASLDEILFNKKIPNKISLEIQNKLSEIKIPK